MAMHTRIALLACLATLVLGVAGGSASALRSIQVAHPGPHRATGTNISFEDESGFLRTVCSGLTLSGTLNERSPKRRGEIAGSITEGRTTGCTAFGFVRAEVRVLASEAAPFTKTFNAILGTLPNITGILYIDTRFALQIVAAERSCLYGGSVGLLIIVANGKMIDLKFLEEAVSLRREVSTESCPAQGRLRGRMTFEREREVTLT